jgi:hypothetical protein
MGKKRTRKTVVSKGLRKSIVAGVKEARQARTPLETMLNKLAAWRAGKNPWITVPNSAKGTNQEFLRVKANSLYGDPRYATANIYGGRGE